MKANLAGDKKIGQQDTQRGPCHIHHFVQTEGPTELATITRLRNQRITRRCADPLASAVNDSGQENPRPGAGKSCR